jgi:hypothetical protein
VSERSDQVHKLLATLARHADLVSEVLEGSVTGGDKTRNAGIEALFALGVLKPYDEDSYRLNPRLREFFSDYFASYHAFEALRRVSGTMQQAQEQWRELRRLKVSGSTKDQMRLFSALDESVAEMAYSIEHNLTMLHALLATQYGNVDDLHSKLRQNRYYARQVAQFLRDVETIDAFVERVTDEATAAGLPDVRLLVTRRLRARLFTWTSQIKDAQAVISRRLFEARLMEARLKRLARFSLWLVRNRTSAGWELPLESDAPLALFRPERIQLRPQPDVADTDPATWDPLLVAVGKMPARRAESTTQRVAGTQLLIEDAEADSELEQLQDPVQSALGDLLAEVGRTEEAVSLLSWKHRRPELGDVSDEVWLMFACLQLRAGGLQLRFVQPPELDAFVINESFFDIEVHRPLLEAV